MRKKEKRPTSLRSRALLSKQVFDCVFNAFDTFQDEYIGADLAYLMGAILDPPGRKSGVDWTEELMEYRGGKPVILSALKENFADDSPLWRYIDIEPEYLKR